MNKASHAFVLLTQPHRLGVSIATLLCPQVPHHFVLPFGQITDFGVGNKAIALKITTGVVAVQTPVLHADPAKFFATLAAVHVVAAFVLLDRCLTPGTFLRVCRHPQCCEKIADGMC